MATKTRRTWLIALGASAVVLVLVGTVVAFMGSRTPQVAGLISLEDGVDPFAAEFDRGVGAPRLVLLLSPA